MSIFVIQRQEVTFPPLRDHGSPPCQLRPEEQRRSHSSNRSTTTVREPTEHLVTSVERGKVAGIETVVIEPGASSWRLRQTKVKETTTRRLNLRTKGSRLRKVCLNTWHHFNHCFLSYSPSTLSSFSLFEKPSLKDLYETREINKKSLPYARNEFNNGMVADLFRGQTNAKQRGQT